jgi:tRNA (guanine-N7-)-methyltransferase
LVLQTDNPAYWRYMQKIVPKFFDFTEHPGPWPDAPQGRTRREIVAMQEGLPIFRGTATPRAELTEDDMRRLVAELPLPRFDADRKGERVDRLERE